MSRFFLRRPPRPSTVLKITLVAFMAPYIYSILSPLVSSFLHMSSRSRSSSDEEDAASTTVCRPHHYTTELISLDPLLIYIENFLRPSEITELLEAGETGFAPGFVLKNGRKMGTPDRTSSSAALPRENPTVACVLERAQVFLGTMIDRVKDDIGPPQLVRYDVGERFNRHHDWYDTPQPWRRGMLGKGRTWNRIASFFAVLEDACEGGETWFPHIEATHSLREEAEIKHLWRAHPEGGLAFKPIAGNSLFWVNLHANGTGDMRASHSGMPVTKGRKTAMNIWPRKFYD
ncbi:hypothetical protein F5Y15DRAFT_430930 [Xylariaceae sp. FL0016]|nr:hypothetical protein F5Y15DRAFT_430930 [Xylariaceae sp. FL0016]